MTACVLSAGPAAPTSTNTTRPATYGSIPSASGSGSRSTTTTSPFQIGSIAINQLNSRRAIIWTITDFAQSATRRTATRMWADHIGSCKEHKQAWHAGSNFFSSWQEETEDQQRKRYD